MELISTEQRDALLWSGREFVKIEFRDRYAIDDELFEAWRRGDKKMLTDYFESWLDQIRKEVAAGRRVRRVRIISLPLSDYQRTLLEVSDLGVEAGEELRWLPRRLVSGVPMPGNDCFAFDDFVMFNVNGGNDEPGEIQLSRDPEVVKFCLDAFDKAWDLATPHGEFKPE